MLKPLRLFLSILAVAGCASAPEPQAPPQPAPPQAPAPVEESARVPVQPRERVAVAGLIDSARADTAAGKLPNAAATLERALRIEPRNARLWQELALVRLKQGEFQQAEALAVRSDSYAGNDDTVRNENQRIIAEARAGRRR